MNTHEYEKRITDAKIRQFGFDTHARVLGIGKEEVKDLWNDLTDFEFKRAPRTEYYMLYRPELSTRFKPFWELHLPKGQDYLMFYLTPTAPILVPHLLITDKGSIPLMMQNLVSNYDRELMMAFLVHDVECEMERMSRFMTDNLIYEVGTSMKASWVKKNLVYSAVRTGNRYGKKDRVVNGFNINKYNRELIVATDLQYIASENRSKHMDFLEKTDINRAKI